MKGFFPYANLDLGYRSDYGTGNRGFATSVSLIADQGFPPNNRVSSGHIRPQLVGGVNVGIGFSDRLLVNANADLGFRFYNRTPGDRPRRLEVGSVRVMGSAGYAGYLDDGLEDLPLVVGGAVSLIKSRSYWVGNPVSAALKLGEVGVTARLLTTLPESDESLNMATIAFTFGRPFY